jgi:hypothetical protein
MPEDGCPIQKMMPCRSVGNNAGLCGPTSHIFGSWGRPIKSYEMKNMSHGHD